MDKTQWVWVAVGGGAFVLGIIFIVMGVFSKKKLSAIEDTPTVNAGQAAQMASPTGAQRMEIYGVAECETPLVSPGTGPGASTSSTRSSSSASAG